MLSHAGKTVAGMLPTAVVAGLGLPALGVTGTGPRRAGLAQALQRRQPHCSGQYREYRLDLPN
jgi:hypothetical protein